MKKLISLALALVMVLALGVMVSAEAVTAANSSKTYSVTIADGSAAV